MLHFIGATKMHRNHMTEAASVKWLVATTHMLERRFPPPWSVEQQEACFVVRDHNGQKLAYVFRG